MRRQYSRVIRRFILLAAAAALTLGPVMSSFAEYAKATQKESGRSVVVKEVKLENEGASAKIIRSDNEFAAAPGVRLAEGNRIVTAGNAVVYLNVDAMMVLRLDGDSEAVIEKATFGQKLVVNVKKGRMFYNVAEQTSGNASLELMANNVTIAIRGTSGMLETEKGRLIHQLYDGTVEISSGVDAIKQRSSQMIRVGAGPSAGLNGKLSEKDFTLKEVPVTLVEEMKKDEKLRDRVLGSVPLSVGADGKPVFADAQTFAETVTGKEDSEVFAAFERLSEEREFAARDRDPDPGQDDALVECPGCHQMIKKGDPAHAKKRFNCPNEEHYSYKCVWDESEAAEHGTVTQVPQCGVHGAKDFCLLDEEGFFDYYFDHMYITTDEEGGPVYACGDQ